MHRMKVLITGGCGFVGSQMAIGLKTRNPTWEIVCLDNLKRRGSELNIPELLAQGIGFVHGDVRMSGDLESLSGIDMIIDAAAEPSVTAGLDGGREYLIKTNLNGTINCLNHAMREGAGLIFLSTSRVYPIRLLDAVEFEEEDTRYQIASKQDLVGVSARGIAEDFGMKGSRSMYGASKYASELFIEEYTELLGLRSIVNRCGVIAGPHQMGKVDQGVVTLWVARHMWKMPLSYIGYGGTGKQVRDLLHIEDLVDLVHHQIANFDDLAGSTFNVGGGLAMSASLLELTEMCQEVTTSKIEITSIPETRAADVRIYITDNGEVVRRCGWEPQRSPRDIVRDVYEWIRANEDSLKPILK